MDAAVGVASDIDAAVGVGVAPVTDADGAAAARGGLTAPQSPQKMSLVAKRAPQSLQTSPSPAALTDSLAAESRAGSRPGSETESLALSQDCGRDEVTGFVGEAGFDDEAGFEPATDSTGGSVSIGGIRIEVETLETARPHSPQNSAPGGSSVEQYEQIIVLGFPTIPGGFVAS